LKYDFKYNKHRSKHSGITKQVTELNKLFYFIRRSL